MRRTSISGCCLSNCVGTAIVFVTHAAQFLCSTAYAAEPVKPGQPGMARVEANVFALANTDSETKMPSLFCGSMGRELFRQSLLIAARDELGLNTLDASIGEIAFVSESPATYPYRLEATFRPTEGDASQFSVDMKLSLPGSDHASWNGNPIRLSTKDPLAALAEQCELLSRNEFVQALKDLGFAPQKVDANANISDHPELHLRLSLSSPACAACIPSDASKEIPQRTWVNLSVPMRTWGI